MEPSTARGDAHYLCPSFTCENPGAHVAGVHQSQDLNPGLLPTKAVIS